MRVAKDTTVGTARTFGRYRHDGQAPIEDRETRTEWPHDSFALTRYGLGARGVDLIEMTTADLGTNNPAVTTMGFPIYDAHGNNVATLTRSGSGGYGVGNRRAYDAWGVIRAQDSPSDPQLRYCGSLGHKADDESGLVYMRARYYDPAAGRFVSEDPGTQGRNWFAYCGNDPVNRSDQSGREWGFAQFFLTFVGGCLEFFAGLSLLGWADQIRFDGRMMAIIVASNEKLLGKGASYVDEAFVKMQQAARRAQISKGVASSVVLKAVGYSMVLSGLLIDIDLAPDGDFDILQTFFGGS